MSEGWNWRTDVVDNEEGVTKGSKGQYVARVRSTGHRSRLHDGEHCVDLCAFLLEVHMADHQLTAT